MTESANVDLSIFSSLPILERSSVPPKARRATAVAALPISFMASSAKPGSLSSPVKASAIPAQHEIMRGLSASFFSIFLRASLLSFPKLAVSPAITEKS